MAVRVIVPMSMTVIVGVAFYGGLGGRMAVIMSVLMIMIVVLMAVIVVVMVVVLAHASFPLAGSAICSSISFRTSLICASAAE